MPSEKEIDNYIDKMDEENVIYVEKELEYAEKCHNLEQELGCPLDVLFKAMQNGVYYEDIANCMQYLAVDLHFNLDGDYVLYFSDDERLLTKNYKKTWWLKKDKSE